MPNVFYYWLEDNPANGASAAPKAHLSVLFFDERFNFVSESSEMMRVQTLGNGAAPLVLSNIKVPKNGYCLVFISADGSIPVYFDDLQVRHDRGRLLEENHYYATGLKIAPLSSKAFGGAPNNYQYQGAYSEFDYDLGWNDFMLRSYDPQIGRFLQHDPYDQFASGYVGMGNDPGNMVDPTGGWSDPPIKKNLPGRLYQSKDAAAWAWARLYIKFSVDNNVELSSVIYEYQYKGVTYFGFTQATWAPDPSERYRSSPGPEHFMKEYKATNKEWDRSHLVPKGAKIVGHIHSHGGENSNAGNINPSPKDKTIMGTHNHLTYYLVNYKGKLKKFDPEENVGLWGSAMVINMYCGKQCREKIDNDGAGSKTGVYDPYSKSDEPLENILLTGNSTKSQIINDKQALDSNIIPGLLKIASTANAIYSTTSTIATASSISKGLACPVF